MTLLTLALCLPASAGPAQAALRTQSILPASVVPPTEPVKLYLSMQNRTDDVLYFQAHRTDACWIDRHVDIVFDPPAPSAPVVGDCPSTSLRVPPNERASRTVDLTKVYGLDTTRRMLTVTWKGGGTDVFSPVQKLIGPIEYRTPIFDTRVLPGDPIPLPDKSTLRFDRFKSPPTVRPGEDRPLLLEFTHVVPGVGETQHTLTYITRESRQALFKGYVVEIKNHQFGQWLEMRLFDKF